VAFFDQFVVVQSGAFNGGYGLLLALRIVTFKFIEIIGFAYKFKAVEDIGHAR
jgi:hypothetical protein